MASARSSPFCPSQSIVSAATTSPSKPAASACAGPPPEDGRLRSCSEYDTPPRPAEGTSVRNFPGGAGSVLCRMANDPRGSPAEITGTFSPSGSVAAPDASTQRRPDRLATSVTVTEPEAAPPGTEASSRTSRLLPAPIVSSPARASHPAATAPFAPRPTLDCPPGTRGPELLQRHTPTFSQRLPLTTSPAVATQ